MRVVVLLVSDVHEKVENTGKMYARGIQVACGWIKSLSECIDLLALQISDVSWKK